MKRKGCKHISVKAFTLIELLAVIVILSLILAVAVPTILGIIEKSRKDTFGISVSNILRQLKYEQVSEALPFSGVGQNEDISYSWTVPNGKICLSANNKKYEIIDMNCTDAQIADYRNSDELRIESVTGNPTDYTNSDVTLTVTAAGGLGPYKYSFDNGVTYQDSNQMKIFKNTNIYVNVKDSDGTILDYSYEVVIDKIDKENPSISLTEDYVEINQNDSINLNDYVKVTDNVGVKHITETGNLSNAIVGTYNISYQAEDVAGNLSDVVNLTILVKDKTPPTLTLSDTSMDWYNSDVTINVSMQENDGGSGIAGYVYCLKTDGTECLDSDYGSINTNNQIVINTEGISKLSVKAVDVGGNYSDPIVRTLKIDKTPPVVTVNGNINSITIDNPLGTQFVIPTGTAIDSLSGINGTINTTGTVSNIIGTYTITYTATDNADNITNLVLTVNVIDTSAPNITLTPPIANSNGWYKNDINLLVTATDNDNISSCEYKVSTNGGISYPNTWIPINGVNNNTSKNITITDESDNIKALVRCYDNSSLFNEEGTTILKQDKTPPVCINSGGSTTWTNTSRIVTGTCNDALSGCSSNATKAYNSDINSTTESPGTITDIAGNSTVCPSNQTVRVDKTPPSIPTVDLNGYTSGSWTNKDVTQTYSATDALSGIQKYQYSYDNSTWTDVSSNPWIINYDGSWTFYARSVDNAGNVSDASNSYVISRDTVVPTYTYFYIGGGNNPAYTTSTNTNLYFSVSEASEMCISTTTSCNTWETYASSKPYTLSPSDGTKTLYVWFRNVAGSTIGYYSDSITLDTTNPVLTLNGNLVIQLSMGGVYTELGATASDNIDGDVTSNIKITGTVDTSTVGTYTRTYTVSDTAGNMATVTRTINVVSDYVASKGVNKPRLVAGMTAVKWNGSSWVNTTEDDTSWYDYPNHIWANAKTADGSMWVWIPRYIYKITSGWHSNSTGAISIQFTKDTNDNWNSGAIGSINTGTGASASNNTWTNEPAFTFGSTELTGFWVAKFEATAREGLGGSSAADDVTTKHPKILSEVVPWTYLTPGTAFTVSRNMETDSTYGWGTSGNGIDTHLTKNVEWGAVAYLSQSTYGKNGTEVWINPDNTNHYTGRAGNSVSVWYPSSTYAYNTSYGVNASTTGTIYGVYDMSGGVEEYTAAYTKYAGTTFTELSTYGASILNANSKYKDVYVDNEISAQDNYTQTANMKGDAVYETSNSYQMSKSWFADYSNMPYQHGLWFQRGGYYGTSTDAGVYAFEAYTGAPGGPVNGFRPVLAVDSSL